MMALNELEMKMFSEGSTGTGGRVDELTLPVDTSPRSRSQQTHTNEKDLDLEMSLQKGNIGAGPSGGSSEDGELVHPVSESRSEAEAQRQGHVTFLEPIREEDEDEDEDGDDGRTHQPVGGLENTDHIVTVEESDRICRTCGPDDEDTAPATAPDTAPDNLLVNLGCDCRGSLCRMHRKCIIEWYGPRIYQQNNYNCELCNALLHGRIERIVYRAFVGHDSGSDILFKALASRAPRLSRRPRRHRNRNAIANVEAAPTAGNAPTDFHQIHIVEIMHLGTQRPLNQDMNRTYYGSPRGVFPMCVMVFIIVVLIGFGVASVGKLHH